jgi:hypothetical protein
MSPRGNIVDLGRSMNTSLVATMVRHVERKAIFHGTKKSPTLTYSQLSVPCVESGESPLDSR